MCDPYGDLLSHVLNNGDVADVTVNQRALVDKILARYVVLQLIFAPWFLLCRYSSEFTVYRELLQNSDDAESSEVEIEFCSGDSPAPALHSGYYKINWPFFCLTSINSRILKRPKLCSFTTLSLHYLS
jgi:hypothetical protein